MSVLRCSNSRATRATDLATDRSFYEEMSGRPEASLRRCSVRSCFCGWLSAAVVGASDVVVSAVVVGSTVTASVREHMSVWVAVSSALARSELFARFPDRIRRTN
jgi:hypothetical protein